MAHAPMDITNNAGNTNGSNEDIKAVILNYGKYKDAKSMEDFLAEHNVAFDKVQKTRNLDFGFVRFATREERDAALPVLCALEWCGEPLEAKAALVKRDNRKRKHDDSNANANAADADANDSDAPAAAPTKTARDVATPWADVPYGEQLARKEAEMKKVLVKITRSTRKEFDKKEKRIAVHQRKDKKARVDSSATTTAPKPTTFPQWLTSHGSLFVIADDVLYSRVVEAAADAAWTRELDAPGVTALVSFGSELVAATADNAITMLTRNGDSRAWTKICDGPADATITSLASLRSALICCTSDGQILKQEGTGRFATGVWTQLGEVEGARMIGLYNRQLYAHCPETHRWWRAPLPANTAMPLEALVFVEWTAETPTTGNVVGLTSHNTDLVLLTTELTHIDGSGKVVQTLPVVLGGSSSSSAAETTTTPTFTAFTSHKGLCCPMDSIHPSPVIEGYRNKCEFTIGFDADGAPCVGFRLGLFRDGLITTAKPNDCANVSKQMQAVAATMQKLVEESAYPVYNVLTQEGVWRCLTVRESARTGDLMVIVQLKPPTTGEDGDDVDNAALQAVKEQVKTAFTNNKIKASFKVTSLFVQLYDGVSTPTEDHPVEHLFGKQTIEEHLLDMRFSVSPGAFFQVNTRGAETLYALVQDHAASDANTMLYDVCCGTGTIGICAAKKAHKVVGIELCKAATDDAAVNAQLNDVTNVSFINDKAENVMKDLLKAKRAAGDEHLTRVVAIVDPPRGGLHINVLRALRSCPPVERIVYVSCNPTASLVNDAQILCGPNTKALLGEAFEPVHAAPVDMFPHTPHCEMIIVFERVNRAARAAKQ